MTAFSTTLQLVWIVTALIASLSHNDLYPDGIFSIDLLRRQVLFVLRYTCHTVTDINHINPADASIQNISIKMPPKVIINIFTTTDY